MDKKTILVAEDERSSNRLICKTLKESGYEVMNAATGKEACGMAASYLPDLLVINPSLPDMDGTEVIADIRRWSSVPIIVVSARNRESQKVAALDAGADDYIIKPFGKEEFAARVRAALRFRRAESVSESGTETYSAGELSADFVSRRVACGGREIRLTRIEFKIFELLCKHSGKVITYDYMLKQIWGPYAKNSNKILRVNITNIRKKIEPDTKAPIYIFTEPGIGYRVAENELTD